ncbi:MAG TPA: ribosome maturation factor RimP [Clostridiaceae bacterium]|nr:ribosome maturation factor RimP [Clostridiaceae bacterium]
MAKRSKEEQRIYDRLQDVAISAGLELIDVKYIREGEKLFLRVFADRKGGVTIEELAKMSELADAVVDNEMKLNRHDYFEVSSPGLDRPLSEDSDFLRYAGEVVSVKSYEAVAGKKLWQGKLISGDDAEVQIEVEGEIMSFPRKGIAVIKREVVF